MKYLLIIILLPLLIYEGCTPPVIIENEEKDMDITLPDSIKLYSNDLVEDKKLSDGNLIFKYARIEQKNSMYEKNSDSVSLYWINKKIALKNHTKCNIFALNTLFKAGFLCPKENARTTDLMNTNLFEDVLPVAKVHRPDDLEKGDLIIWYGHVIIFDSVVTINKDLYALAIWAGTRQKNNGKNTINNVTYGRYPLSGDFLVRRPIKKRK